MALDIIGLTLIIIFFIRGYMKGIIIAVFSLLAVVVGVICSLKLSEKLATWFHEKHLISSGWAQIISYLIIFTAVFLLIRLIAKAIESVSKAASLNWLNKTIGGLLYAFMICIVWSSVLWLSNEVGAIKPEMAASSKTYPYLSKLTPWLFEKIGLVWPMVKDIFRDLQEFFANIQKGK